MEQSDLVLRPAEKINLPYDKATSGSLWPYTASSLTELDNGHWPIAYCTDDECAALSGIPKPSLLALQTAEVIHATKAPIGHGTYRRVWPIHEVAVASAISSLKSVAHVDFKSLAKISYQAAVITRVAFADFVRMRVADQYGFGANLVLSENQNLYLQISPGLKDFDPGLGQLADARLNVIPIASPEKGKWKSINLTKHEQRREYVEAFNHARFQGTVVLGNVFLQFERDARKMRT